MTKALAIICLAGSVAGCVSLRKPETVEKCSATGNCVDDAATGAGGTTDSKAGIPDGPGGAADGNLQDAPSTNADGSPTDSPRVDSALDARRDISGIDVAPGACIAAGTILPAGTVCRQAIDPCDLAESCDGVSSDCPADKLATAGASCRPKAGDCDVAETCDGITPSCPADGFKQAGIVCREVAAGALCDVAESCTGTSAACPVDSVAPASTVCHPSKDNNRCDPAETCTGTSVTCPTDVAYVRPVAPANPTTTVGTLQITLGWSPSGGATAYNVKRSAISGNGYTTLGNSPTTTALGYVDQGLAGGAPYYYVVSAISTIATCESPNSKEVTATPTGACTPPAAPTAKATPGNGSVTLDWAGVAGAVSYTIARSASSGTGYATIVQVTPGTTTTYSDSNVTNGATYYYIITASNGTCSSVNSAEVSAAPACTPPAPPTDLTATFGNSSATLSWTASAKATSYAVYKNATGAATYTLVNSTSMTTFTDTNVANGTKYYYVVTASNGSCSSAYSSQVAATPACVPPAPPTGVTVTPDDGQNALSWTASTGATSYGVSRSMTGTGAFASIGTPTTTNYLDKSLANGTPYYYVVTASNGSCSSANSELASATPLCTPPSVPGAITATAGDRTVTLSWVASTPAPASYTLQRKTDASGTWAAIATPTVASYADGELTDGSTYYYQVSASNGSCSSTYNTAVSATPVASCSQTAPTSPQATATGSVQVSLAWTAATLAPSGGYNIARSPNSATGFTSIGTVESSTLTYVDASTSLVKDTVYYYKITAVGATCTAAAAVVSVTTACANPAAPSPAATADGIGNITVSWAVVAGATAYTVYRSDSADGTHVAVSNQTAATYTDATSGLGTFYYYKVLASNAAGQCLSSQSSATSARACTIPAVPVGVTALRSGNRQATLVWTNSTGAKRYDVLRSTTSGSGYTSVGTSLSSPYNDSTAANRTAYYYVLTASSDADGNCSSANSAQVSVPVCTVWPSGTHYQQLNADVSEWCVVTCADIGSGSGWAQPFSCDSRTPYFNGVQATCNATIVTPAKANGGYAFYFTGTSDGGYVGAQVGNVVADADCP